MNIKSYKRVCDFCDKILLSKKSSIFTHSITSLHVLKEHPILLDYYFDLGRDKQLENNPLIKKIVKYIYNLFKEKKNFHLSKSQKNGSDVLILSNIISSSHANNSYDFYFGYLEKFLNKKNIKTFTALRNFTNVPSYKLKKKLNKNKILLHDKTFISKELKIFFRILKEFLFINKSFDIPKIPYLKKKFLSFLSFRSMVYNLRLRYQIKHLIKIISPKLIIIPFEGHAWERVIIKTIKDTNPNIKVAAYQFSITTKFQHALFRPLKKDYNPDIIFSSGSITKKKFQKNYDCKVDILGSNKFIKLNVKKKKINNNFLIVPEGFQNETELMLNFTISLSKIYKDYKFIFRVHPLIKTDKIHYKIKNYKNIFISSHSLKNDLKLCTYVIFRGSATVFEAIKSGLKPIYLKTSEFDINPLHDVYPKILNIKYEKDLKNVLTIFNNKKINKKLVNYADKYFFKPNFKKLEKFAKNLI